MAKSFNTTAVCIPEKHYMVNIEKRLYDIGKLVEDGKYFTINRARQYGKTTTLLGLIHYLKKTILLFFWIFRLWEAGIFPRNTVFLWLSQPLFWMHGNGTVTSNHGR